MLEAKIKSSILSIIDNVNNSIDNPSINDYFNALIEFNDVVSDILECYKNNNKKSNINKFDNGTIESLVELVLNSHGINIIDDCEEDIIHDESIVSIETIKQYYKDVSKYKVYSYEEQLELFQKLECLKNELKRETSEENRLVIEQKIKDIKDNIFLHSLKLVIKLVNFYQSQRVPILDLIQEGNIGLYKAIDKFDYHKGFKFTTYASWWVKQAISSYIANNYNIIRIPINIGSKMLKVMQVEEDYYNINGTLPSENDLVEKTHLSKVEINNAKKASSLTLISALDAPVEGENGNNDSILGDFIPGNDNVEDIVNNKIYYSQLLTEIKNILYNDDPRSLYIILARCGFFGKVETLESIGEKLHISRERVRQLENKSLNLIRNKLIEKDTYYIDKIKISSDNKYKSRILQGAKKQLENIKFIEDNNLYSKLDKNALIVLKYRKQYKECTLLELANIISVKENISFPQSRVSNAFNLMKKIKEEYYNVKKLKK